MWSRVAFEKLVRNTWVVSYIGGCINEILTAIFFLLLLGTYTGGVIDVFSYLNCPQCCVCPAENLDASSCPAISECGSFKCGSQFNEGNQTAFKNASSSSPASINLVYQKTCDISAFKYYQSANGCETTIRAEIIGMSALILLLRLVTSMNEFSLVVFPRIFLSDGNTEYDNLENVSVLPNMFNGAFVYSFSGTSWVSTILVMLVLKCFVDRFTSVINFFCPFSSRIVKTVQWIVFESIASSVLLCVGILSFQIGMYKKSRVASWFSMICIVAHWGLLVAMLVAFSKVIPSISAYIFELDMTKGLSMTSLKAMFHADFPSNLHTAVNILMCIEIAGKPVKNILRLIMGILRYTY